MTMIKGLDLERKTKNLNLNNLSSSPQLFKPNPNQSLLLKNQQYSTMIQTMMTKYLARKSHK